MGKKYRGNSGEDISKLFYLEGREKKKIGSNIFSRASTRKGGGNQPLRTPSYYMSNKEKKKLNGEVMTMDMNTILNIEDYNNLDQDMKKKLMIHWRDKFSVRKIQQEMSISGKRYYEIIDELNIEKGKAKNKRDFKTLSDEELDHYKSTIMPYEALLEVTPDQRYSEILPVYFKKYSFDKLAKEWNIAKQRVYTIRHTMTKHVGDILNDVKEENISEEIKNQENISNTGIIIEEIVNNDINNNEEVVKASPNSFQTHSSNDFFFVINQSGNNNSIIKKLNTLSSLLEDEDGDYEISLTVQKK